MRFGLVFSMLSAVACQEASIKRVNTAPEAFITSHGDGDTVIEGSGVSVRGQVSDTDNALTDLTTAWFYNGEPVCPDSAPDETGSLACAIDFSTAGGDVALEVRDPDGAVGTARVDLTVQATDAPVVALTAPTADGIHYSDHPIALAGTVSDTEDAPGDLTVRFETAELGDLGLFVSVTADGDVAASASLEAGEHTLRMVAIDTDGKEGSDHTTITVGPANAAPTCTIETPADGDSTPEGEVVEFEATVGDANVPPNWITVNWESDIDGPLGDSSPAADGSVSLTAAALSAATHRITLTATDEVGAVCTDSIDHTVATPPTATITLPTADAVFQHGDPVAFAATIADEEDPPTDVSLSWSSDVDGPFASGSADVEGTATASTADLSPGVHTVTLTATDTHGLVATDTVSFRLNQPPVIEAIAFSPDPAHNDDTLVCSATVSDPEGGTPIVSYEWTGGVTGPELALDSSMASPLDTFDCTVTAIDDDGAMSADTATVTIANRDPSVSVTVTPIMPTQRDTLTCTASDMADPDGDPTTIEFEWIADGIIVEGTPVSETVSTLSDAFYTDDFVLCKVYIRDDKGGEGVAGHGWDIANIPPEITDIVSSPDPLFTNDTLTIAATISDADGHTVSTSYAFEVDGSVVQEGPSPSLDGTAHFDKGQTVQVAITASDSWDDTVVTSELIRVQNSLPSAPEVRVEAHSACPDDWEASADGSRCYRVFAGAVDWLTARDDCATEGGTLATVHSADDNDQLYALASGLSGTSIWLGLNDRSIEGDWVWTSGEASDYTEWLSEAGREQPDGGTTENCAEMFHDGSSEPTWRGLWADMECDSSAHVGGYACEQEASASLQCVIDVPSTDDDADPIAYLIDWDVDGTPFTDTETTVHTGDSVAAESLGYDETWTCTVTPNDGEDDGPSTDASIYLEKPPGDCTSLAWDLGVYQSADLFDAYPSSWTLEGWFKPAGGYTGTFGGGFAGLPAFEECGSGNDYHMVVGADGAVEVHEWYSYATTPNTSSWMPGEWFHFAIQFNADATGSMWVDGQLAQTYSGLPAPDASCPFYFGNRQGSWANTADGALASLRFSNGARYSTDFDPAAKLTDDADTVWLFDFNEGGGSTTATAAGDVSFDVGGMRWANDGPDCDDPPEASTTPASCWEWLEDGYTESGTYRIDPTGEAPFDAYCDMSSDGGGWTLIAMVHPVRAESLPEPAGWFSEPRYTEPLATFGLSSSPAEGLSSFGVAPFMAYAVASDSIARFTIHADEDHDFTYSWFKDVVPSSFARWFDNDTTDTLVCHDVDMTESCGWGIIKYTTDVTSLGVMRLPDELGGSATSPIHMRLDGDVADRYSAICSSTGSRPGWPDSYEDHWGNGLSIWLR